MDDQHITSYSLVQSCALGDTAQEVVTDSEIRHHGKVVKLDRGYPQVKCDDGTLVRCEHAQALVREGRKRAVIGDRVCIVCPHGHDKAIIEKILPREREFVRKDPTERSLSQVLAANFDRVIVVQPLCEVNVRRLERELVLAHETGAAVTVVLTKADLAESEDAVSFIEQRIRALVGSHVQTLVVSCADAASVERVRALIPPGDVAILIGKSGVGKSSLVNLLVGEEVQQTAAVRETDGKGRHTTVSREMIDIPQGGSLVDMPGVRGLGLWDADEGIETAFADIEEVASRCRFRDCKHEDEPHCAVRAAVEAGEIAALRWESYRLLKQETEEVHKRREHARWMQKDRSFASPHARSGKTKRLKNRRNSQ